jgi:hypothetical protein
MTFWPLLVRIRALKPDVLFCLRLVPPRVRCVIIRWFYKYASLGEKPQFTNIANFPSQRWIFPCQFYPLLPPIHDKQL